MFRDGDDEPCKILGSQWPDVFRIVSGTVGRQGSNQLSATLFCKN